MNALAELRKRTRTAANPANPANQEPQRLADSRDSHDSQGVNIKSVIFAGSADALKAERARLLALAAAEWIDAAHVHRLHDADLADCLGLDDHQRVAFLHLLDDIASRHAGRVPLDDTAAIHCRHCGPVWTHPDIAAALPTVGGWPRALGCPWCFVRRAGGYIPRPPVICADCGHFNPDTLNPAAGMGDCGSGHGMHWAGERHTCASFQSDKKATP